MELEVITTSGASSGKIQLPDEVFNVKAKKHLVYEAVKSYMANQRLGTAHAKTRSEVKASSRKPWKQKGLGRARAGTAGSPVWVGGGVAHGPRPHDHYYALPKKARRSAIRSALSAKAQEGGIKVVEALGVAEAKTKRAVEILKSMGLEDKKCLLVTKAKNADLTRATRNIPGVKTAVAKDINIHDILAFETLVIDKDAVGELVEVLKS
ncbi:MAG TPA: 50S ribosomal protein L4 [bacterium]|nr:50S ribosomal protein L4 [bacterium]